MIKSGYVDAVIDVFPPVSRWVREQAFDGITEIISLDNDVIRIHIKTEGREGLMRKILEWGGCAEVISPPDFRKEMMNEIKNMYQRYRTENIS